MAGLLDLFGNADDAQRAGLLMLAAAGPRAQPASFGQRLLESVQQFDAGTQQKKDRAAQEEERKQRAAQMQQAMQMQAFQMQQAQTLAARQAEQDAATRQFRSQLPSPEMAAAQGALAGGGGPTVANAQRMQPVDPNQSLLFKAMQAGQVSPMDYVSSLRKDTAPIKVGAGETLLHPGTMKPLFTNPKPEDLPADVRAYEYAKKMDGYKGTYEQWAREMANLKAPRTNVNLDLRDPIKNENDLRREFADLPEVKNYKSALPAYSAVEDAAKRNTPQSDINLVYGIAKLYDPTSVVREGEYATIANSQSIPERVKGYAQFLSGGGKLTPETKAQLLTEARGRINSFKSEFDGAQNTYSDIVKRRGGDTRNVFTPIGAATIKPPEAPKAMRYNPATGKLEEM